MKTLFCVVAFLLFIQANAQNNPEFKFTGNQFFESVKKQIQSASISADSLIKIIANWNNYPAVSKTNQSYIFYFNDPYYGKIPMRLFIPASYKSSAKTPFILLLHGAVGISSFKDAYSKTANPETSNDVFFNYFSKQGYIILQPYADHEKKFDWVVNDFVNYNLSAQKGESINLTYRTLVSAIIKLKHQLNIDDTRIYAFGHSDGADGAFCMGLFQPNLFAGSIIYNSLLSNLNADNIYLENVRNWSMYIVHSDLDDIRPIQQTKLIADSLKKMNSSLIYKEYKGYKHDDKHLSIDAPYANKFMQQTRRNLFKQNIFWESNNKIDNQCDWIKVNDFDITMPKALWQRDINFKVYNKIARRWENGFYYINSEGYAIQASYKNNTFQIKSSRVKSFNILINQAMVNLNNPLRVYANGKLVFNQKISADKNYMLNSFEEKFDRQAIWVNSIKINL